ncbi:MAG: hypothetical protein HY519_03200 [Candidatus Aenigmarchaeota archaeon]|nr:hypothetical protein [Candidatus Aenigmarchaeota archaeon]
MRAQAAFEYMVIVGIVLAFLIPVWLYVSSLQARAGEELSISYAENAVQRIAKTADLVFSQGSGARVQTQVYIPGGVESSAIIGRSVILNLRTGQAVSNVTALSIATLNGTIPTSEGSYQMTMEAKTGYVQVTAS